MAKSHQRLIAEKGNYYFYLLHRIAQKYMATLAYVLRKILRDFVEKGMDLMVVSMRVMLERRICLKNVAHNCKARNRALVSHFVRMRLMEEHGMMANKMKKMWEFVDMVVMRMASMMMGGMRMEGKTMA